MKKCDCYHEETYINNWWLPTEEIRCVCWGTREKDECQCSGDRTKCDFYKEIRAKAKEEERAQLDIMELEFYRYYLQKNDLVWDAANEYNKWKKNKKEEKK